MNIFETIFIVSTFLVIKANSINLIASRMAVDYFKYKNVKQICTITCTSDKWSKDFALLSSGAGMSVCSVSPMQPWQALERCLHQERVPVGVILDVGCHGSADLLQKNSEEKNFDDKHAWLLIEFPIFENENSLVTVPKTISIKVNKEHLIYIEGVGPHKTTLTSEAFLEQQNISVDADITIASKKGNRNEFHLFDVFNFGKIQGGKLIKTTLGYWTDNLGLVITRTGYKYQRRWNFHNVTLRAISVMLVRPANFSSEMLTGREYTPGVSAMTKITSMVIDLFREKHNFRFNYTIADRWVGGTDRNSTLAVTNSMLWQEQDISSTCLRIFPSWLNWMDPIFPPITDLETKFYYRIPTEGVGKLDNEFLRPFSSGVWSCAIFIGVLCSIALAAAAKLEGQPRIIELALFSVIATFCQQMFEEGPCSKSDKNRTTKESQSRKLAILVTGLSSLLLYNYYTSSVVSWLLSAPPPTIDSLNELIRSSLEVVFEDIGYTRSWLEVPGYYYSRNRDSKEDVLRETKVKGGHRTISILQKIDSGIELVKRGGYAYHTEPYNANIRIGQTFSQEELCDLGSLQMMERSPVYVVGQRRSPYREFFVWSMMRATERGHMSCMRRRVHVPVPECSGSTPRALALGGTAPAFLVLAFFGWSASVLLLLLEIIVHAYCSRV